MLMDDKTRKDNLRNMDIRDDLTVALFENKIRKKMLQISAIYIGN